MNVAALIGLADLRSERDPEASEVMMEAARDILRLRLALHAASRERDELRHKLFEITGDRREKQGNHV